MYIIYTHKRVDKFLDKHRDIAKRFIKHLSQLQKNPYDNSLDIKALDWEKWQHYRLRIGKYRFLYEILEDRILIYFYDVGSRWDIYK